MDVLKDSIYMIFGKSIKTFGNLIFTMIISRVITQQELGTYKQIITISTLIFTIIPLGIPISISYYYNNIKKNKKSELITNSNLFLIVSGFIVTFIIFIMRKNLNNVFNNDFLSINILGLMIYTFSMILSSIIENCFISNGNSAYISKYNIIYYIIYYFISINTIILLKNINIVLILMGVLEIFRFIILNFKLYKIDKLELRTNMEFFKQQFIFCIPLGLATIVQNINTELDKIFISINYTPVETAIYSNGSMNIPFVGLISITVASVTLPIMTKYYKEKGITKVFEVWNNSSIIVFIILTSIFWSLFYYAKGYIELVFSSQYMDSIPIFIIYLIKLPLSFTVFGNILIILGKKKATLYNMILAVLANILFNYIFIFLFGFKGPAIVSVIIHIMLIILQLIQISKVSGIKFSRLMPYKEMIKNFLVIFIISTMIKILSNFINISEILKLFLFGGISVVISLGILLILNKDRISKLIRREY